jgi:ketopantoate reductase
MKTLIVGTGVIGVIYGWALYQAGEDVTHFVRPGKAGCFQDGAILDLLDERKGYPPKSIQQYPIHCVESIFPEDGYELIIIPTNSQQVKAALKNLVPVSGNAIFLIFSGNWDDLQTYDAILSRERYLLGYPDGGGTIREGIYWTNLGAEVHLGLIEGQSAEKLELVKQLFINADMCPDVQENILHWLWVHNAGVIGFAAGLAKYCQLQPYLADRALVYQSICATKELYGLCAQRGVDLNKYPEVGFIKLPIWLTAFLLKLNFRRNESMQRYTAHATCDGSLRESKYHFNQMMKTARELNIKMPNMEALGEYFK